MDVSETQDSTAAEQFISVAQGMGVLGLNPHTDAIRQPMHGGMRIWYYRDGEIRTVSRTSSCQTRWNSDRITDSDEMVQTLTAADEFEVIDVQQFNWLASALDGVNHAHDGLCWGLVIHFEYQLSDGDIPSIRRLQAVPGIGNTLSSKIGEALQMHTQVGEN